MVQWKTLWAHSKKVVGSFCVEFSCSALVLACCFLH